jgi:hypothetical protein
MPNNDLKAKLVGPLQSALLSMSMSLAPGKVDAAMESANAAAIAETAEKIAEDIGQDTAEEIINNLGPQSEPPPLPPPMLPPPPDFSETPENGILEPENAQTKTAPTPAEPEDNQKPKAPPKNGQETPEQEGEKKNENPDEANSEEEEPEEELPPEKGMITQGINSLLLYRKQIKEFETKLNAIDKQLNFLERTIGRKQKELKSLGFKKSILSAKKVIVDIIRKVLHCVNCCATCCFFLVLTFPTVIAKKSLDIVSESLASQIEKIEKQINEINQSIEKYQNEKTILRQKQQKIAAEIYKLQNASLFTNPNKGANDQSGTAQG